MDFHKRLSGDPCSMEEKWTALHVANALGYTEIVHLLLEKGASIVTTEDGEITAPYDLKVTGNKFSRRRYGVVPQWKGKTYLRDLREE